MTLNHLNKNNFIATCTFVVMTASGAIAENVYGGFDIVETPGAIDQDYANVRGWHVTANYVGGNFAFCSADKTIGSRFVSIGYDGMQWQLAVPIPHQRNDWSGVLEVDGSPRSASGTATNGYSIAWLGLGELDRLKRGNHANLGVGKFDYDFSLSGVTASTLKVSECVQRAGKVPTSRGGSAGGKTTQSGNLETARASCETVFNGRFGCTLTKHPKEGSYLDVITVESDNPNSERYLVKRISDSEGEVWVSYSDNPDAWNYKGYWQPTNYDRACIEPAPNQGLAVQDALGQDAWMLCIR